MFVKMRVLSQSLVHAQQLFSGSMLSQKLVPSVCTLVLFIMIALINWWKEGIYELFIYFLYSDEGARLLFKFRSGTHGLSEELDFNVRCVVLSVRVSCMCCGSVLVITLVGIIFRKCSSNC